MRKYTIAPSNTGSSHLKHEIEKLNHELLILLKEIDTNLSNANFTLNKVIIPKLKKYADSSSNVLVSALPWKLFFENSANLQLNTFVESVPEQRSEKPVRHNFNEATDLDLPGIEREKGDWERDLGRVGSSLGQSSASSEEDKGLDQNKASIEVRGGFTTSNIDARGLATSNIPEVTPSWQTSKFQSSTPQVNKGKHHAPFDSLDTITPPVLSHNLIDKNSRRATTGSDPNAIRSRFNIDSAFSGTQKSKSNFNPNSDPEIITTIRHSVNEYHKLSISPKKSNRRSLIEDLLSSPTMPEPPILRSEISPEEIDSNNDNIIPPELSPNKRKSLIIQSPKKRSFVDKLSPNKRATLTPKRLPDSHTPDRRDIFNELDEIPVPQLHTIDLQKPTKNTDVVEQSNEDISLPQLNTIDLRPNKIVPNEKDNVFIDFGYHDSHSTLSQAFDQIKNLHDEKRKSNHDDKDKNENENTDSNISENTNEGLDPIYNQRFKSLFEKH